MDWEKESQLIRECASRKLSVAEQLLPLHEETIFKATNYVFQHKVKPYKQYQADDFAELKQEAYLFWMQLLIKDKAQGYAREQFYSYLYFHLCHQLITHVKARQNKKQKLSAAIEESTLTEIELGTHEDRNMNMVMLERGIQAANNVLKQQYKDTLMAMAGCVGYDEPESTSLLVYHKKKIRNAMLSVVS